MSNMSLEELEARCETLQRRVQERSSASAARSPPRPHSGSASPPRVPAAAATRAALTTPRVPSVHARDAPAPPSESHPQQQQQPASAPLAPSEVAAAISALEAERRQLHERLRVVDTHLRAYHELQRAQFQQAAPAAVRTLVNPYSPPPPQRDGARGVDTDAQGGGRALDATSTPRDPYQYRAAESELRYTRDGTPPPSSSSLAQASTRVVASPQRHRSPARGGGGGGGGVTPASTSGSGNTSLQTEEIYRELQAIRKAREEREAQRRAALQAAATPGRN